MSVCRFICSRTAPPLSSNSARVKSALQSQKHSSAFCCGHFADPAIVGLASIASRQGAFSNENGREQGEPGALYTTKPGSFALLNLLNLLATHGDVMHIISLHSYMAKSIKIYQICLNMHFQNPDLQRIMKQPASSLIRPPSRPMCTSST